MKKIKNKNQKDLVIKGAIGAVDHKSGEANLILLVDNWLEGAEFDIKTKAFCKQPGENVIRIVVSCKKVEDD